MFFTWSGCSFDLVDWSALLRKDRSGLEESSSIGQLLPPTQDASLSYAVTAFSLCNGADDNGLRRVILVWLLFLIDLFYNQSQYIVFCRRVLLAVVEDIRCTAFL